MPTPVHPPYPQTRRHFLVTSVGLGTACLLSRPGARLEAQTRERYLFAYFTGNGEDGLHFARSADGLTWLPVAGGRSFLPPRVGSNLMRDPSIVRGGDGQFHLVWTTGWWDQGIGLAHSRDLVTWSAQTFLPVMADAKTTMNCWAPEIHFDPDTATYVVVWASTVPGLFPETAMSGNDRNGERLNHRLYAVTTKDFATYTPTRLFYDGGFNVIDGVIARASSGRYALIVKDETQHPVPKKNLRVAWGDAAIGPYGAAGPPFTAEWVEGPSVLRVGEHWLIYYDEYTRKRYGAMRTRDFATFEDVSAQLKCPEGMRHGTAFAVPVDLAEALDV